MTGVILAAGCGARLNHGGRLPKCLVPIGGQPLLARNVALLRDAGLWPIVVVVGCASALVRRSCAGVAYVENRRYATTNSLYSLWLARAHLSEGFVVMNCDVLAHPRLLASLLAAPHEDALLLDWRGDGPPYGEEEMKVRVAQGCVADISKAMAPERADGENVGIVKFGRAGARVLVEEMDALVQAGEHGAWAPRAFGAFARRRPLRVVGTGGLPWIEIDFPEDYRRAVEVVLPRIEGEPSLSAAPASMDAGAVA